VQRTTSEQGLSRVSVGDASFIRLRSSNGIERSATLQLMTTTKRKLFGLLSLGTVALAVGLAVAGRAEAAVQWEMTVGLMAITTDAQGVITTIKYRHMNVPRTVNGCGAKLEALPHLMEHYRQKRAVDLGVEKNCLKGVAVRQ
jgi:hypothetical protein